MPWSGSKCEYFHMSMEKCKCKTMLSERQQQIRIKLSPLYWLFVSVASVQFPNQNGSSSAWVYICVRDLEIHDFLLSIGILVLRFHGNKSLRHQEGISLINLWPHRPCCPGSMDCWTSIWEEHSSIKADFKNNLRNWLCNTMNNVYMC